MSGHFIYNPAVEAILRSTPLLEAGLKAITDSALATAQSIAPVDTGAYRASLAAGVVLEGGLIRGRLSADIRYAIYLEFGTSDTPTFATLRRAISSA